MENFVNRLLESLSKEQLIDLVIEFKDEAAMAHDTNEKLNKEINELRRELITINK